MSCMPILIRQSIAAFRCQSAGSCWSLRRLNRLTRSLRGWSAAMRMQESCSTGFSAIQPCCNILMSSECSSGRRSGIFCCGRWIGNIPRKNGAHFSAAADFTMNCGATILMRSSAIRAARITQRYRSCLSATRSFTPAWDTIRRWSAITARCRRRRSCSHRR